MRGWSGFALLIGALLAAAPEAKANGYATDDAGRLYRVEPDESSTELMGTVRVS